MAYYKFGDPEGESHYRDFVNPGLVDQLLRQAVQGSWMLLPKARRNADETEKLIRTMMERVLRDFREDCQRFSGNSADNSGEN